MTRFAVLLLLASCGAEEALPTNVEGTLDGHQLALGGGGWAWEEPRQSAGEGGVFRQYAWYLELSGMPFDPTVSFESLTLEERHTLAQQVALHDRLSFKLSLSAIDAAVRGNGNRFDPTAGQGTLDLAFGSPREAGEAAGTEAVNPIAIAGDRGWVLLVDELTLPEDGVAGRIKGSLELVIARQTRDRPDSLTGNIAVDFDVPFVGAWLGRCQKTLLLAPEGQHCPR